MENNNSCCAPTTAETAATSCCQTFTDREQALIALAGAIALNKGDLVKQAIIAAKQTGVNNEEIGLISEVVTKMQEEGTGMTIEEMAAQSSSSSQCCR